MSWFRSAGAAMEQVRSETRPRRRAWPGLAGAGGPSRGAVRGAGGGALIAGHARHLAAATASTPQSAANVRAANAYRSVLPGIAFSVPEQAGISATCIRAAPC
jgi:hypothetical protein